MEEKDAVEINFGGLKNGFDKTAKFFSNKNIQLTLTLVLFALILISSTSIRLTNLQNLQDKTTGHYVFADPDAFYEYRVAETIIDHGNINGIDTMRNPGLNLTYTKEMLPVALADAYNVIHALNSSITLDYIDILYPVIAFSISLVIFFILCWYLSKSKAVAVIASLLLAYSPTFFGRTAAGVSSHEALGVIFMFLSFLVYAVSINNYKKNWKHTILLGVATGLAFALSLFSWSGGSNFALMIFPLTSLIYYFFGVEGKEEKKKFITFNLVWVLSSVIIMPLFSYSIISMASRFTSNYGVIVPFAIILMALDFTLESYSHKIKAGQSKYRVLYSLAGTVIIGIIGLMVIGKNPIVLLGDAYNQLLYPFGQGRVGLTVAYYAQPYVTDLINQLSVPIFWIFFLGMVFIGVEFGKNINSKKYKLYFYLVWIFAISGMLFSRISSTNLFNGTNFISSVFYVLSFLVFAFYLIWLYLKEKFTVNNRTIFLAAWMVVMLMSARSAIRVLFVIVTFTFVAVAYFIVKSYEYGKKTNNQLLKYFLFLLAIIALLLTFVFVFGNPLAGTTGNYQGVLSSATYSGPITGPQWQDSMSWVRNNTNPSSVFISWWDYGYMIQSLGNRTTVVDGGNSNEYWDHMVGRYLLTEPNVNASLSFMKTHNVSYLLIDPTDIGKYAAYSTIGSDESGQDRASYIPTMVINPSQTQETNNSTIMIYQGAANLDQDIVYHQNNGDTIFLPQQTAILAGVILQTSNNGSSFAIKQPQAVFINNQKQISIPIRYVYFKGQIMDFGGGLDSGVDIIPAVSQTSNQNIQIDQFGSLLYLSPKVFNSLFAQLYLMNDPFNRYPTISLANSQLDPIVTQLKQQNAAVNDFVFYNGIQGPLKIWKVDYPSSIISRSEFLSTSGTYGEFDNLTFTK